MKRVVVTGIGIASCLGTKLDEVSEALRLGKSGIAHQPEYAERGMRSHVAGMTNLDLSELIDRKLLRFMGAAAGYAHVSMQAAIEDAGLETSEVSTPSTGIIAGSGGASSSSQVEAADILREKGLRRVGP